VVGARNIADQGQFVQDRERDRGPGQFRAIEGNVERSKIRRLNCTNSYLPW
jgi:hypothetical protein